MRTTPIPTTLACAVLLALLPSCASGPPVQPSPQGTPPTAATPMLGTATVSPGMATLISRWATDEARGTATPLPPSPTPSATQTPTLLPAGDFPPQSLARVLAGSPECHLPCWQGITPGKSSAAELEEWLANAGLSASTVRTDYETGTTFEARHVNPHGALPVPSRLVYIHTNHRVDFIDVDIDFQMPPIDEFQQLVKLLGVPDTVLVEHILGDYSSGYALRFLYPARGVEISYFEDAEELILDGRQTTVMCLGRATSRTADLYLSPHIGSVSYEDDPANLAPYLGLSNEEFLERIFDPLACISI